MESPRSRPALNRRQFIKNGTRGASVIAAVGATVALYRQRLRRNESSARFQRDNPFAYRVDHLQHTDPKLIQYKEIARFRSPRAEARRVAIGTDSHIYLTAGNYVSVVDGGGSVFSEIALSSPPRCLAVADDGAVYIGLRDHVEVFTPTGRRQSVWEVPGQRAWLTGLAVGQNEVCAADAVNRAVLRYDRSGKLLGRIGEKSQTRNAPGFIVPSPFFDLELGADGLLRVTNPGRHRVDVFTPQGDWQGAWGESSAAMHGFCGCCNPINLALLPDGRCVTCEKGLPRVKVYSAAGGFDSVVAGPESFPENLKTSAAGGADEMQRGLDASVDARGRIYILDPLANEVRVMESVHAFRRSA